MAEVAPGKPGVRRPGVGTATVLIVAAVIVVLLVGGTWVLWESLTFGLRAAVHMVIDYLTGHGGVGRPQ